MRAVMLEVNPKLLAERARLGLDRWDELWAGELHMVPPPTQGHQLLGTRLLIALAPLVEQLGLTITYETGFFRAADDYRVPDLAVYGADVIKREGVEGAEMVIEILSPGDESRVKIPWYFARRCREALIVDPDTLIVELHTPGGLREPATSEVLGCSFTAEDGPELRITWSGGEAGIRRG